jgi:hypothetical protein
VAKIQPIKFQMAIQKVSINLESACFTHDSDQSRGWRVTTHRTERLLNRDLQTNGFNESIQDNGGCFTDFELRGGEVGSYSCHRQVGDAGKMRGNDWNDFLKDLECKKIDLAVRIFQTRQEFIEYL